MGWMELVAVCVGGWMGDRVGSGICGGGGGM